ncbi:TetR/AcrR family transcriptional regulator [Vibrio europaeus]|uniref:TetR/AcrR family transcriptional regulator n=1 Tax=Vibrio europaeus TaxID=300876 RepID=A0AAE7DZ06_9VIBR|nr:TetR/AcrR family transcriptional regulator [Vibrio europaeus]MDC5812003.1 TetR/AcrR family transcriptional regulator [Vibrio europaeus]QJY38436.1 TetR/AcrR family transcriptional regulator [Vibrio europaeus]QPG33451.1 TetR/AcrR family transcriptional regulator [Vibrio europaeus]
MSVKQKRRGRPQAQTSQLDAERILSKAKELMLRDNKMPSVRGLATELSVDAMAIYHYFRNKNALQESIVVSLIEDIYQPDSSEGWRAQLSQLCFSYVSLLHRYPGLLETLLKMDSVSPANVFIERYETIVKPLGLTPETTKNAIDLLADYLHGFALALNCQPSSELTLDMLAGPLSLYCQLLEVRAE